MGRSGPQLHWSIQLVQTQEEALHQAHRNRAGLTLWSDGSRLEDERVGTGIVWKPTSSPWQTREIPLGRGKEVFDAELYGACEALELAQTLGNNEQVTVFL